MTLTPLIPRTAGWHETADWETIHYMAAIRAAKSLALEYRDPDLLAVVLAVPVNDTYVFVAEVVHAWVAFDPYPGSAVVLHIVAINHAGEPSLLPNTFREDIPRLITERLLAGVA